MYEFEEVNRFLRGPNERVKNRVIVNQNVPIVSIQWV